MKISANKNSKGLAYSLLCALFFFVSITLEARNFEIKIDNKIHSLVAEAGGCSYQWFKDGAKLEGQTDRFLPVKDGGDYKVEITDETGIFSAPNVTVAITAVGAIIKIYTIGDSTVQDYNAGYYPRKGWGQVLPSFFNAANVQVINKAVGGTSSKSFYNSFWPAVKNGLVAGDFVFIQFGINDRAADADRKAPTGGVFEDYLTRFINETRAKGAFPVLVTTVRRNAWNADGVTVYDSYHDHPVAVRTVAKSLNVPLIDLDAKLKVDMEAAGKVYSTRFWHNNYEAGEYPNYPNGSADDVHFQEMGAIHNASLLVQGIKELSADANVSKLIPFIKAQYQISVTVNPLRADSVTTRTASYPQGLTVTLKTFSKAKSTFQKWNNASATQISTAKLTTVTSGTAATSYTAIYKGAVNCSATISTSGSTTLCQGGSVTLTVNTGSSYVWKNGTASVGTTNTYKATTTGSYTVEVTDAANCKATSAVTAVIVNTPTLWYADTDADGKGDPNVSQSACVQPTGYVADKTDLCPSDVNKTSEGNCGCGKTEQSCLDCNNVPNGTAKLDLCDRCIKGTGKTACSSVGEAETDACSYDGILESTNLGFKGTSYVNVPNAVGSSITFHINAANAGTGTLSFRYANGGVADRIAQLNLNGSLLPNTMSFPGTGAFANWATADISITLVKGLNILKLISATADGMANIDQIGYVSSGLSKGDCVITGLSASELSSLISVFPNPTKSSFHITIPKVGNILLVDMEGKILEERSNTSDAEIGGNLKPGIYFLKIESQVYKLIKE